MKVEVKQDGDAWSVFVNDLRVVQQETFTVACNIASELRSPSRIPSECAEVAEAIRKTVGHAISVRQIVTLGSNVLRFGAKCACGWTGRVRQQLRGEEDGSAYRRAQLDAFRHEKNPLPPKTRA